jgi:site-specific recombinase XerC
MQICQAREQYVRWLLVTKDLSPHTIRAYDSDIAAFQRHLGIRALVEQIDRDRLIVFIEEQRAAGLCSTSIRRRASGLRGFCKWLLSCSLLGSDPWVGTTVAAGRSRKLPRILPTHELDRLFLSLLKTAGVDDASDSDEVLHRPQRHRARGRARARATHRGGVPAADLRLEGSPARTPQDNAPIRPSRSNRAR